ncbi:MarR family transcriptional regulator [Fictibacillus macauensis ZFHKF-1]|uniref:MarR family transcriptional regulator n=1 Tax=Fictibacillus macauensis ZFHKF-1 TaxID=1196324 RepID=I8AMN4_9BACL|nr:MarR family transcriptional regulator [Fictibacillus macauensis]EIT87257.1 MarR family transcriptional regulator [Fictibacillus macauensis ZFHKF-1]
MNNQEQSLKLFVVLSKAYKAIMDGAVKNMKQHHFSETEFTVLELLYHKGRCPLQQIGSKILITSGSITYNIDKLEKKGYIKRVQSADDRRITFAEITEQGTALMDHVFPDHAEAIEQLTASLNSEEKEQAITLLKKLGRSSN